MIEELCECDLSKTIGNHTIAWHFNLTMDEKFEYIRLKGNKLKIYWNKIVDAMTKNG